ncbi:hypothetical protein GCM10010149_88060 [Nonomuraea roseoviolacea subsp. roseoviolacea]|uniref:hypothetical protein n=1 Tax=Nonomuraea roseoviolacea TaxID=103837 RepID=UPI0031D62E8C
MSQHYGQPVPPQVVKRGVPGLIAALLTIGGVAVGCVGGVAIGSGGSTPEAARSPLPVSTQASSPESSSTTAAEPDTSAPEPVANAPKPSDFKIVVKIIESSCYGTAGANVTYQIKPSYNGPDLPDDGSWRISYRVTGGDNADIGSFTMTGDGNANIREQEYIQTPTCSPKLKAKVTQVLDS